MPASRSAKTVRQAGLTRKRQTAVQALAACRHLIKASLNQIRVTCGKPSCRCAKNTRFRHAALTFTYKVDGRSMCLHVPRSMEQEARQAADDYAKLKKLVQALSAANMKKFRREVQVMKAKSLKSRTSVSAGLKRV